MIQSIIIYSVLFAIMLLFAIIDAKRRLRTQSGFSQDQSQSIWKTQILIPVILFSVVFGMRYDVGTDHLTYLYKYVNEIKTERYEPLFGLLTEICQKLDLHYAVYFSILAFIQVFFFYYTFKDERYLFPFLIFFFFTTEAWMPWMNIIRQSVATCIWIYSLKFIEKNKVWKYTLYVFIAFCFHRSAIILLLFYPILKSGRDYFKSIPLQFFLLAIVFIVNKYFSNIVLNLESLVKVYSSILGSSSYSDSYDTDKLLENFTENEGTGLAFSFKLLVNLVVVLYSDKLKRFYNTKRFNIIYFFFFIGLLTLYVFPPGAISISRPFRFFYTFTMIMYGYFGFFLYYTRKSKGRSVLLFMLIIAFLAMFYLSQITATEDSHKWYQFYFQVENK